MNRVLRATGQAQIPCELETLEEDNHLLILEFLNQFKEEIEGYHQWRSLKQTWDAAVPANVGFGFFGSGDVLVTNKARLFRVQTDGRSFPLVYDKTDPAKPFRLHERDLSVTYDALHMDGGVTATQADTFSVDVNNEHLFVRLYPVPNTDRTVTATLIVPQKYLDVSDLDTPIDIPTRALLIGTVWAVLEERGEELGQSSMWTEERYILARDQEVSSDLGEQGDLELVPV